MKAVELVDATVLGEHIVRFQLSNGKRIYRDLSRLGAGVLSPIWEDPRRFRRIRIIKGVPTWPPLKDEIELCKDVILRGGLRGRIPRVAVVLGNGRLRPVRTLPNLGDFIYIHECAQEEKAFTLTYSPSPSLRKRFARQPVPPTARECFARDLLAYGIEPGRREMTPAHQLELVRRFPRLYRLADAAPVLWCRSFSREGFAVGDGWFGLLGRLSAKLSTDPRLMAVQVKEKMGRLRVYLDVDSKAAHPSRASEAKPNDKAGILSIHASPFLGPDLVAALDSARKESSRTCEICGEAGRMHQRDGWLAVRCEPCSWLDEMVESCKRLRRAEPVASGDVDRLDACCRHVQHLGEASAHQPAERRARLPGIDWALLDRLRPISATSRMSFTAIRAFIRKAVPSIESALR